jgi:guanylate kinase
MSRASPTEPDRSGSRAFRGGLAVFSGPSGSGKTSICRALLADPRVSLSISATTRPPRVGERDGVDYHFYDRETFEGMLRDGEFVEWAEVYGFFYGTPRAPLLAAVGDERRLLVLDIDVQGVAQLRQQGVGGIYVFVAPPSLEVLRERLRRRGTDSEQVIERRLTSAASEMAHQHLYDHVLVNEDLDRTILRAREILGL